MASHQPLRVVSRRARLLLQRHRAAEGRSPSSGAASKSAPKKDETPWPKSLRYTFYTLCAASVPFSMGQAIALSPRLREWMLGGDDTEEEGSSGSGGGGLSSADIISFVRAHWGHEDYVPPVDRPRIEHAAPGHRNDWEEDNYSSLLNMLGLHDGKDPASPSAGVPVSLDNEPPFNVRGDQRILAQYLSTKTNPSGVRTRLTLLPCEGSGGDGMDAIDVTDTAGYDTECTLPGNITMGALRQLCQGSDAQSLRRDLAEGSGDPSFVSRSTNERIRTKSWNEDCRWVVSFADSEDDVDGVVTIGDDVAQLSVLGGSSLFESIGGGEESAERGASDTLRKNTAIHSSWHFFPESVVTTAPIASSLGSTAGSSGASAPAAGSSAASAAPSNETLQRQRLEHQISTLEKELKDPSSLRDRDAMYEELKMAKRELRGLKPWWRRLV